LVFWVVCQRVRLTMWRYGAGSFQTRRATRWMRAMKLAVWYWRPVAEPVRDALHEARLNGVAVDDVRILNLNLDVVRKAGLLHVRRSLWMPMLAWSASTVMLVAQLYSTCEALAMPVRAGQKIAIIVIMTLVYILCWRGLSLYTTRAWATVRRCGPQIQKLQLVCESAPIAELRRPAG